ncbi:MAG: hypothetical protein AUJ98_03755 [Bacteroidetes bacterium CG2_30_33_31]|nr:MAG: hypothetical protein AUJ98_03755 [Bacteroidetes bacterium CG2_30_33_31]
MKKLTFYLITALMLLTFSPLETKAATIAAPEAVVIPKATESAEAKTLLVRLYQINELDKSSLNFKEKRQLRKEVKTIKSRLNELGGGIYFSAGAIIIILLLLLILF